MQRPNDLPRPRQILIKLPGSRNSLVEEYLRQTFGRLLCYRSAFTECCR
jgi:hypothetical protein